MKVRFLVEAEDSDGSVSVFECFVPAQAKLPVPHSHDAFEETIYGLDGVSTWTVDGQVQEIRVGDALCVPRGAVHGFDNRGSQDARFLAIPSPGVMGPDYFREVHAVLAAGAPTRPRKDRRCHAALRAHARSAHDSLICANQAPDQGTVAQRRQRHVAVHQDRHAPGGGSCGVPAGGSDPSGQ